MAIIDYPNLTEMLSDDGSYPDRPNGWFLKILDTGETFHRVAGVWVVWGLGLSFAPPTKSGVIITDNNGQASVVFGTPFFDDNYSVQLTCNREPSEGVLVGVTDETSKTATGFGLFIIDKNGKPVRDVTVSWLATRSFNA